MGHPWAAYSLQTKAEATDIYRLLKKIELI